MSQVEHRVRSLAPERLDQALPRVVAGLSRGAARRLIASGAVFLNGRRCRVASRLVRPGDRLRVDTAPATPVAGPLTVLHADDELVCIDKPAGMPSAPTQRAAAGSALEVLRHQLRAAGHSLPDLWVVHRLDAATSGVLALARTRRAAAALSEAFRCQTAGKTYVALVDGIPPTEAGTIELPIRTGAGRAAVDSSGRPAHTAWQVIRRGRERALLELRPRTGRMHQLRVHLAAIGYPVVGDRLYGGSPAPRLMLHAAVLELPWPSAALRVAAPIPAAFDAMLGDPTG
jgi:23S rRNA pseudouridine1911/1915/1917 synthase